MRSASLHSKLLWAVFALIVGSGLAIAVITTWRYRQGWHESVILQTSHLAATIADTTQETAIADDGKGLKQLLDDHIANLLILSLTLVLAYHLIRRLTHPLRDLAESAAKVDAHHPFFDCPPCETVEIRKLASAFAKMIARVNTCSQRLDASTVELDRAYDQFLSSFEIMRTIGGHSTLQGVCSYLFDRLTAITACSHMAMLTAGRNRDLNFIYSEGRLDAIPAEQVKPLWELLADVSGLTFIKSRCPGASIISDTFQSSHRIGIFPLFFENQKLGALFVGCPKDCQCHSRRLQIVSLLLQECAGAVKRAIDYAEDLQGIQCKIGQQSQFCGIVGKDRRMQAVYKLIDDIAPTDAAVLIQGESGTGKELVARAIHQQSPRKKMPFVVINCSAYPASLLESELFGHEKGAFTGAIRQKIGRFEQADGGTVFLDEIGDIAPSAQINLLRVLQTQTFERIGGEKTLHVQVRVIAATNKDLIEEVKHGRFREDLYYRLNVIPIYLPPLRQRRNDIPLLARYFLDQFNREQAKAVKQFRTETIRLLLDYAWPGNVRELENTIEHALVLTKGDYIEAAALPANIRSSRHKAPAAHDTVTENERRLFQEALDQMDWNKKLAARRLGISRSTLYNKIKKYRLVPPTIH